MTLPPCMIIVDVLVAHNTCSHITRLVVCLRLVSHALFPTSLDHSHRDALSTELAPEHLFVLAARRCGYPLDVSRRDGSGVAAGITMVDATLIRDGDRLESAVRVFLDTARAVGWAE